MRAYNNNDPDDMLRLLMEIATKATNKEPLDGEEGQYLYFYAIGLELKVQYLKAALYSLGYELTYPPSDGKQGDGGIIFED